ncbi:unnamed protein product [Mytilus edulis]|uniref:B box-type domain-containing protein n=1 Tax=Mytilus edulis TaxID=6550 RepID=A0A8S3RH91_MYTED|nr:unnamed protein product [Mytilus edulis]
MREKKTSENIYRFKGFTYHFGKREIVGKCLAPIRPSQEGEHPIQKGECLTPNTEQCLDSNRTIVTIENPDNDTEGFWTCYHGTNRDDDSVYVPTYMYLPSDKSHPQHEKAQPCTCHYWEYAISTFIAGAFAMFAVLFVDDKYSLHVKAKRGIRQLADISIENKSKYRTCTLCDTETAFAFCCDCQGFYCEKCANNHVTFKDHHIIQTKQIHSKNKTKCYNCKQNYPNMVCRECANVFCSDCVRNCGHSHDNNLIKYLIITEHISIEPVIRTNQSDVLRKKYDVLVSVSSNKSETRIRGIAFLN